MNVLQLKIVFEIFPVFRQHAVQLAVLLCYPAHGTAGIAVGQIAVGNILGNDAAGADDDVISYVHAAQDGDAAGQPDIVADMDVFSVLGHRHASFVVEAETFLRQEGMICRHKRYVGAEADVVADVNAGVVHDSEVEVGEEIFADKGMTAVIKLNGTLEIIYFSDGSDKVPDDRLALRVVFVQLVEAQAGAVGLMLHCYEFRRPVVEDIPGENFFFFCHGVSPPYEF